MSSSSTQTTFPFGSVVAKGSRVVLRRPLEADREAWGRVLGSSREHLSPWISLPDRAKDPRGEAWFNSTLAATSTPRHEKLFVALHDDGGIVGTLNLNEIVRGCFQSAFLGYWIGAAHAGKGLMTEALELGLRHAFGSLGLHRVEANIQPENAASKALVRRAGFLLEGFSPRYLEINGCWRDHERWALTVEPWTQRRCLRDGDLRLRPLHLPRDVEAALSWYADSEAKVRRMFEVLAAQGEVFLIEVEEAGGRWRPIGDVTLGDDSIPITIGESRDRARGFGGRTLALLIGRARALGWKKLVTRPIELENTRSLRMFERAGFVRESSPGRDAKAVMMTLVLTEGVAK